MVGYYTDFQCHFVVENREIDSLLRVLIDGVPGCNGGFVGDVAERARQAMREHPGLPEHQFFQTDRFDFLLSGAAYSDGTLSLTEKSIKNYHELLDHFISWITPYLSTEHIQVWVKQAEDWDTPKVGIRLPGEEHFAVTVCRVRDKLSRPSDYQEEPRTEVTVSQVMRLVESTVMQRGLSSMCGYGLAANRSGVLVGVFDLSDEDMMPLAR